ncbi:MAG: lipopolysaccharide biosynthesis protein [Pseudarthrobacter sp.]|nr:lipopolysaccharide biosynthesis protein [Pseudarthrobacter sp.]
MKTQFIVVLLARIFATGVQALTFILLARWAGVEDFGMIGVIAGICAVLFTVADWGLSSYIPRARAIGKDAEVVAGIRMDFLGNSAAGIAAALVLAVFAGPMGITAWFVLIPVALAIEQFTEVALTIPIADKNKGIFVVSLVLRRIVSIVFFIGLYLAGLDAVGAYAVSAMAASAAGLVHVLAVLRRRLRGIKSDVGYLGLYKALVPYLLANLSAQSRTLDTALVGAVSSVSGAGLYSAAFRLINPLMLVSSSLVAVLLPHASRKNLQETKRIGWQLSLAAVVVGVLAIPVIANAGLIMELLFGSEFLPAAPAFAFAVAALPFLSVAPPLGGLLQSQGFESFVAKNGIAFAVVNLVTVLIGALLWGPTGAAAAVAVSYAGKSLSLYLRLHTARPQQGDAPRHLAQKKELRTV